jgi:hypothetical protein
MELDPVTIAGCMITFDYSENIPMFDAYCGLAINTQFAADAHQRRMITARKMRAPTRAESPLSTEGKAL